MNSISIKFFVVGEKPFQEVYEKLETPDSVLERAYELAFDSVGYGLTHWDFVERSFNKATKQLSEIYRFNVDTTSHYQLCLKKQVL